MAMLESGSRPFSSISMYSCDLPRFLLANVWLSKHSLQIDKLILSQTPLFDITSHLHSLYTTAA